MKVIFGADMSFNYLEGFPGKEKAHKSLEGAAKVFEKADFRMVNLENVFGKKEDGNPIVKSGPNLLSDDDFIEYIHALKPEVVGLANNHTKDYDEGIMFHTIDSLKACGYKVIGAGKNIEEAYASADLEKDGVKILGNGELKVALKVVANKFTEQAKEKIMAQGGSVEEV